LITTAYLDEAERCNRIGLMHKGVLIQCDSPAALKLQLGRLCYEVLCTDPRRARAFLQALPGVTSVERSGSSLHLFLDPDRTTASTLQSDVAAQSFGPVVFRPIPPSVEDVFIAMIDKSE
jgi:ABC-2 type transport system ATP-binding protein